MGNMKIKGLKKAVGTYQETVKGNSFEAELMYDFETGKIWTDQLTSGDVVIYGDNVMFLGREMRKHKLPVDMYHVRYYLENMDSFPDLYY